MSSWEFIEAEILYGKVTDGTHDSPKPTSSGYPLVTSKNIKNGILDLSTANLISINDYIEINKRSKVDQWDVVISMIGEYCGYTYIENNTNINYAVKNVGLFKTGSKIEANWLSYYLRSDYGKHFLKQSRSGSSQPYISLGALRSLKILNPPIHIKKGIVNVLEPIDSKIQLNNKINEELEGMAKTLYDYWFVQFNFPNAKGKPYKSSGGKMHYNKELKREIPVDWEVKPLSKITSLSNESVNPMDFPDKEFNYYSIPCFDENGTFKIEKGIEIKSNKYSIKNTDVLVSKLNPWFSRVIYATDDSDLISSTEFVVWRAENIAIKNYIYMIAKDASFVTFCTKSASGTSNSHKRVNPAVMMKYQIVFNHTIATLFGNTLGSSIKMLAKNKTENQKLIELRDWLLPMLMNGQVKVGDAEKMVEEKLSMAAEEKGVYKKSKMK